MTTEEIKAVLEHVAGDAEAIANAIGKPEIAASIKKFKEMAESPFALEALKMAIDYGHKKLNEQSGSAG